ncbi:ATP-binding cassette domain-containing protein, partial [Bacillus cereus]|nr:ATP-binding cassette domain-containing protein [Bacillus cereus]
NPADSRRCHIEMVYQDLSLCDTVDVAGNLFMGREPMKSLLGIPFLDEAKMHADAREMLKGLGISIPDTHLLVRNLSGGQRQRVAMGRAIVRDPAVFLFDEPLSNLDAKLRVQMRLELQQLHRRLNTTSLYVTHDQVEAMTLAQRVMVMNKGTAEQVGTPVEVYEKPASRIVASSSGSPAMNLL